MKKITLISLLLSLALTGIAQLQRMAILPASMHLGGTASSLCLDLFRETPSAGSSYRVIEGERISGGVKGNGRFTHMDLGGYKNSNLSIVANGDEHISTDHYKFVEKKIAEFSNGFNSARHAELQNQVWSYGALKDFGYIKASSTPLSEFDRGVERFCHDFDIHEFGPGKYESIKQQAYELHTVLKKSKLTSENIRTIINRERVVVSGNSAKIYLSGEVLDVKLNFVNRVPYPKEQAKMDIDTYLNIYHLIPSNIDIKTYNRLLYFRTKEGSKALKLNMPMLRGAKLFNRRKLVLENENSSMYA